MNSLGPGEIKKLSLGVVEKPPAKPAADVMTTTGMGKQERTRIEVLALKWARLQAV